MGDLEMKSQGAENNSSILLGVMHQFLTVQCRKTGAFDRCTFSARLNEENSRRLQ